MKKKRREAGEFESLPVAAMIVDGRRRILAVNKEGRRMSGWKTSSAPMSCRQLCGCAIPDSHCPVLKAIARKKPLKRTCVPMKLKGRRRAVIERVSPYRDRGTGSWKAAVVLGDATSHLRRLGRLKKQARLDAPTGVLNRSYFDRTFRRAARDERRRGPAAFLMIDIDGLKQVNDTYGHPAGDTLISRLGLLLRAQVRGSDLVGRLGGDEFGIYCPNTRPSQARALAVRVRRAIAKDNAANPSLPPLSVGIGLAVAGRDLDDLRRRADAHLLRYKSGRRRERRARP